MKGTLTKYLDEWGVLWNCAIPTYAPSRQWTPLHPDDKKQIEQDSLVFDNIEARIAASPEVEFHFHESWEQVDGGTKVTRTAKLGPAPGGDYPELEGTMNLCEDIIEKRKEERNKIVKLSEEEWVECDGCDDNDKYFWIKGFIAGKYHNELPEISDEEIERKARKLANIEHDRPLDADERYYRDYQKYDGIVMGMKWYREQLKKK